MPPRRRGLRRAAAFRADCESLVAHYQAAPGKPRVWVNLPPPTFGPSTWGQSNATIRDEIIPLLKQCAAAKGVATIDVFTALSGQAAHFPDGVHPDAAGALLIAQTVQAALVKQPSVSRPSTAPAPSPAPAPPAPTSRGSGCGMVSSTFDVGTTLMLLIGIVLVRATGGRLRRT